MKTESKEKVTPAKAEKWLNEFNPENRKLRTGHAESMSHDMKKGEWTRCIAPIAFYDDGTLADGQHRLWAIIDSQTTQEFLIVRGLSRADGLNIDMGMPRTLMDNARISGADDDLSNRLLGVCRAIAHGQKRVLGGRAGARKLTNSEKLAIVAKYREPALWALQNLPHARMISTNPVLAAIGRARMRHADEILLQRFCEVLSKGFSDGKHESAAISMRNYIIAFGPKVSGDPAWRDLFLKTQNAIWYFIRGRPLTVIRTVAEEQYKLK